MKEIEIEYQDARFDYRPNQIIYVVKPIEVLPAKMMVYFLKTVKEDYFNDFIYLEKKYFKGI